MLILSSITTEEFCVTLVHVDSLQYDVFTTEEFCVTLVHVDSLQYDH